MIIFESAFYPYRMQYAADYGVSLMLLLSVGFLPSGFITYLIRERKSEEKQVQLVSGVTKMTYWMTTFIWDFMVNTKVSNNLCLSISIVFYNFSLSSLKPEISQFIDKFL